MKEIIENLFIGNQRDYEEYKNNSNFYFVLAAKNPWHKEELGYTEKSCDKKDPEYLAAFRENRLVLNIVDAPKKEFFNILLFNYSNYFIKEALENNKNVMICCNKGESRSSAIAIWYMIHQTDIFNFATVFEEIEMTFKEIYYGNCKLGKGIKEFLKENWR